MPYSDQGGPAGLDIPDQTPQTHQLATAGALSKPQSGLDQLGGLAGDVSSVIGAGKAVASAAPAVMSFLAALSTGGVAGGRPRHASGGVAGGRRGYATDGGVNDSSTATDDYIPLEQSIFGKALGWLGKTIPNVMGNLGRANQVSSAAQHNAAAATWGGDLWPTPFFDDETPPPANNQSASGVAPAPSHPWATRFPSAPSNPPPAPDAVPPPPAGLSSQAQAIHDKVDHYNNGVAAATYNAKKAIKDVDSKTGWSGGPFGGLGQGEELPGSVEISQPSLGGEPNIPATTGRAPLQLSTGVSFPQYTPTPTPPSGLDAMAQGVGKDFNTVAGGLGQFASHLGSGIGGYLGEAAKGNPQYLVPFLTGLAAMTAAPTRNFGVALAQGLGTGAQTYMGTQKALADVGETQAERELTQARTGTQEALTASELSQIPQRQGMVAVYDPTGTSPFQVNGKHYKWAPLPMGGSSSLSTDTPKYSYLDAAGAKAAAEEAGNYFFASPQDQDLSRKMMDEASKEAADARTNNIDLNRQATSLSFNDKGILQPGPLNPIKLALVNKWNDAIRTIGHPEWSIDAAGADEAEMAKKMATVIATNRDAMAGQKSFQSLNAQMAAVANGTMPREAALQILSDTILENQKKIDREQYYNEFNKENKRVNGTDSAFLTRHAEDAFENAFTTEKYKKEGNILYQGLSSGVFNKAQSLLSSSDPSLEKDRQLLRQRLASIGLLRYFTGV